MLPGPAELPPHVEYGAHQALNDRILALRAGAPLRIRIDGTGSGGLDMAHDVISKPPRRRSRSTLQCKPERAVRDFNAVLVASAPITPATEPAVGGIVRPV